MIRNMIAFCLVVISITGAFGQDWLENFDKAKETAKNQNREILMVFQGSDWCAPCMKLDQQIWQSEEFKTFASDHYVLLRVDFPKRKKNFLSVEQQDHNNSLAEEYNPGGIFPLVVVLGSDGVQRGTTGYKNMSPSDYIDHLGSLTN